MPSAKLLRGSCTGRDQQVRDLLREQAPVTVISGDSGVGKTRVLEKAASRFDGVARLRLWSGMRGQLLGQTCSTRWGLRQR